MGAAILMMKTQIGLGVLSIPLVFDTLGMIPGIIILLSIATITTWVCLKERQPDPDYDALLTSL
jgi:amino acid permease